MSDLHNEGLNHEYEIATTDAEVVVLAGDIHSGAKGIAWAARQAERLGKPIVYVAGNHEYYRGEYCHVLAKQRVEAAAAGPLVHFLERDKVLIDGVRFLGATLWTDFRGLQPDQRELAQLEAAAYIRDFQVIRLRPEGCGRMGRALACDANRAPTEHTPYNARLRNFTPRDAARLFDETVRFLQRELSEPFDGKTVVVSHFGPHPKAQHPGYPVGLISHYFWSDLTPLVECADLWIFGHSHGNMPPFSVGKCRLVCNQCGYSDEDVAGFESSQVVEI